MFDQNKIISVANLFGVLLLLWLLLSGHYTPLLLGLGGICILFVLAISLKMNIIGDDEPPLLLQIIKSIPYQCWLLKEILKANINVCQQILRPKLAISPTLIRLTASQQSNLARITYANSITLTPGTIAIDVDDNHIEVHCLTKDNADDLVTGTMAKKISQFKL